MIYSKSTITQSWKMLIYLHKRISFNPMFYPEAHKLRKNKIATKQQIMQIRPFLLASPSSFLFGIQGYILFDPFYPIFAIYSSFTNIILLK